jgi:hypothetical protein
MLVNEQSTLCGDIFSDLGEHANAAVKSAETLELHKFHRKCWSS